MMSGKRTTKVRVGVRVRPLASKEIQQGGKESLLVQAPSISIGNNKRFTYDAVFDSRVDQETMYSAVSGSLLDSFIEGYNATILAYGQTGSGKTFTMGSEAHTQPEGSPQVGLIPRFISDFFTQMKNKKCSSDASNKDNATALLDYTMKASFLEVYGEDVYDLLDSERHSLPLREDSAGGVVIAGLTSRNIDSPAEALHVLHEGTNNRTTAATLMNLTSSRSHAVFTIYLSQTTRSAGDEMNIVTESKFTFVDLAGSERMKKTGAEGERAREGIKINEGLLALGNVINALADDHRQAKEKKIHVPYRQSKLTRLLQDALGGNSQTLFLACVSPSDTNASETLSTMHYANRARNIRNAPTKNVDANSAELHRLYALTNVLQSELVKAQFQGGGLDKEKIGQVDEDLMQRTDVEEYIRLIHEKASQASDVVLAPEQKNRPIALIKSPVALGRIDESASSEPTPSKGLAERFDDSFLEDVNPDQDMAILDHLLELQQHDTEYDKAKQHDEEQILQVEGELEKGESLLLQLRKNLKAYHSLKQLYEELMGEVQQLEAEKVSLAEQLEKAKVDPSTGCSNAIKRELERVEMSLSRARRETLSHRQKYKAAEDQAKRCRVLERKIGDLKTSKRDLLKKQKETALKYKTASEAKTKELFALRRKEQVSQNRVSKMKTEIQHHKKNLEKRKQYCSKLSDKLKQTEAHLTRLLSLRRRDLESRSGQNGVERDTIGSALKKISAKATLSREDHKVMLYIMEKMVSEKVEYEYAKLLYKEQVTSYSETMRDVVGKVKDLHRNKELLESKEGDESATESTRDLRQQISDHELKLELLESGLKETESQLPDESKIRRDEEAVQKLMAKLSSTAVRQLLMEAFSRLVDAETKNRATSEALSRKDGALMSFESEVELLQGKVESLTKDLAHRSLLTESGENVFDLLKRTIEEKVLFERETQDLQASSHATEAEVAELRSTLEKKEIALSEAADNIALAEASLSATKESNESKEALHSIHAIWEELGVDEGTRQRTRDAIEFSLSNTCTQELQKALQLKQQTEQKAVSLRKELTSMREALGISVENETTKKNLLDDVSVLEERVLATRTPFQYSFARWQRIAKDATALATSIRLERDNLPSNLQVLVEQKESCPTGSGVVAPGDDEAESAMAFLSLPPKSLENNFLNFCEDELAELRVKKSELLLNNRESIQHLSEMVKGIHASSAILSSLVEDYFARNGKTPPGFWDKEKADKILQTVTNTTSEVSSICFETEHIQCLEKALSEIASSREKLAETLRTIVENAQETLLDIVGRELDASEAYASFRDALLKLPALSKDFCDACLSEIEALILGVETMTQSEIEALTVVWEALKMPSEERRSFWGRIDKENRNETLGKADPFSEIQTQLGTYAEEWISAAITGGKRTQRDLEIKLGKLGAIHAEVDRLRSKQDVKSQVLSLDSEIRILNTKLADFEDLQCSKQRLLSKKTRSTSLLKEERFRKQMKGKFVAKLGQLASLLTTWKDNEGQTFDSSMLSDDVRKLLEQPDKMDVWIEKRTKLMPSRTIPSASKPPKRTVDIDRNRPDGSSSAGRPDVYTRHKSGLTPPRKRSARSARYELADTTASSTTTGSTSMDKRMVSNKKRSLTASSENSENADGQEGTKRSYKIRKRDSAALLPFGRILAEVGSPQKTPQRKK